MMTNEQLRELKKGCERATPGPWTPSEGFNDVTTPSMVLVRPGRHDLIEFGRPDEQNNQADIEFVAMARSAMPQLLAAVAQMTNELQELRAVRSSGVELCRMIDRGELPQGAVYASFKERLKA